MTLFLTVFDTCNLQKKSKQKMSKLVRSLKDYSKVLASKDNVEVQGILGHVPKSTVKVWRSEGKVKKINGSFVWVEACSDEIQIEDEDDDPNDIDSDSHNLSDSDSNDNSDSQNENPSPKITQTTNIYEGFHNLQFFSNYKHF